MNVSDALNLVKDEIKLVEEELINNLDSSVPMVNEVISYVFESGGKRMRPVFLNLASKLCGYEGQRSITHSGIVEYVHTATLLHDDVIDGAKYRRGRRSANWVYGNDITVLCGDFLYSRGFINLIEDRNYDIQMIMTSAVRTMSEGEVFQLVKTADIGIKFEEYIKIILSKTAVLFSACCEIGAILGERTDEERMHMREFGTNLGIAFQMSDDILDYLGDPEKTGKKPGTDLWEGKLTLPVLELMKACTKEEKSKIEDIILADEQKDENLEYMLKLMHTYNIKEKSEAVADGYAAKAKEHLSNFPDNEFRRAMEVLADHMVTRDR